MCGIFCEISHTNYDSLKVDQLLEKIKKRGPDGCYDLKTLTNNGSVIFFCGAVLWMQGPKPIMQPLENNQGVLLFNGDIFNNEWENNINDTVKILEKLTNIKNDDTDVRLIKELKLFKGPFSLIYFDKNTEHIYFARDRIGRNSLLFHINDKSCIISSVLDRKYECVEVPATHIYKLNTNNHELKLYSWTNGLAESYQVTDWYNNVLKIQNMPDEDFVIEANLSCDFQEDNNVLNYIETISTDNTCKTHILKQLLHHNTIKETVNEITQLLQKSIKVRLERQPNKCKNCLDNNVSCKDSSVGILFSGGLDCTILAFLADQFISKKQSIDLINVSFKKDQKGTFDVPDRLTGKKSLQELTDLCPDREWIFREINVTKAELEEYQKTTISDLVYPRQTILDESLGAVLWFAARGKDHNAISPCRVLLIGSGADELFGGYTRHRNNFKRQGWVGLEKELLLDWKRISFRNLARDNRVICDHGRQPRMPYLDEDFTDYVLQLKPWFKCCPSSHLGPGIGDKIMLRLVAFQLGLEQVATFPKRAMQFGSRIANRKEKGNTLSQSLKST